MIEGAGVPLAVVADTGAGAVGPATVLVHGMGGTAWPLDAIGGRVIAYDRRGYGASGVPQPFTRTTVNEHAEDLAAVIRALDAAPAVLVGVDFGALVVLDVVLRHRGLMRGAVLVDPPAYMFVPAATEALSQDRAALEDELRASTPAQIEASRGRIADFGALATLPLSHAELGKVDAPVAIVSSAAARPHDVAASEALLEAIPTAEGEPDLVSAIRALRG